MYCQELRCYRSQIGQHLRKCKLHRTHHHLAGASKSFASISSLYTQSPVILMSSKFPSSLSGQGQGQAVVVVVVVVVTHASGCFSLQYASPNLSPSAFTLSRSQSAGIGVCQPKNSFPLSSKILALLLCCCKAAHCDFIIFANTAYAIWFFAFPLYCVNKHVATGLSYLGSSVFSL